MPDTSPSSTTTPDPPLRRSGDVLSLAEAREMFVSHATFIKWGGALLASILVTAGGFALWVISSAKGDAALITTAGMAQPNAKIATLEGQVRDLDGRMTTQISEVKADVAKVETLVRTSEASVKTEIQGTNQKIDNLTTLLLTGKVATQRSRE